MDIDSIVETLSQRHDPERDVPGPYCHPYVSATEYKLLMVIKHMQWQIDKLFSRVEELEAQERGEY